MKVKTTTIMPFKRRMHGKTDYAKRLALMKSGKIRMVIRCSNKGLVIQFVQYSEKGDIIIYNMHSSLLKKLYNFPAKCNTPTAYLTGLYAGIRAKAKGVAEAIVDINKTASKGAIVFVAVKGATDAGINIPMDEAKIVPERLNCSHLQKIKQQFDETKLKVLKIIS